ncbi:MAG TPA: glycoside hydrolase family 9 protein [Polyangiaceae bacterium]|nr:glycoside hydrolase family 9 protein [Polyangiaceae bacterium]
MSFHASGAVGGANNNSSRARAGLRLVGLATAACVGLAAPASRAADSDVRLNSVGYVPSMPKHVTIALPATTFLVHRAADDSVATTGAVSGPSVDADTQTNVYAADFSALTEEGQFYVEVPGVGRSVVFPIGADVYRGPMTGIMLGFYGWRCGTAVSFTFNSTTFMHAPCHMQDARLDYITADVGADAGASRDGIYGWHDAGDYGKYVVNGAFAAGMMLRAWEQHADALATLKLPIPESGGALPDFLAEVRWELAWLLKMQYSATDGRVSHKLTSLMFDGFEMPDVDTLTRYYVPFGSAATADFTAVLAQAARVYAQYDAAFAAQCLQAAKLSYAWLQANPANVAANQTGFSTGGYGTTDPDDRYWAAAEVWSTTGDATALADFESRATAYAGGRTGNVDVDFDWGNVRNLGTIAYVLSQQAGATASVKSSLVSAVTGAADKLVSASTASAWGRAVGYYWGANGSVARACMLLDTANTLAPNAGYLAACADQLANLFGRNQYGRSQVTGFGVNPPLHPHHRPSIADGITPPWPGLLVGGAQTGVTTDTTIVVTDAGSSMPKSWVDDQTRYWVNEVAINWNGALAYALATFLSTSPSSSPITVGPAMPPPIDDGGIPPAVGDDGGADAGAAAEPPASGSGAPGLGGKTATTPPRGCGCHVVGGGGEESGPDGDAPSRAAPWAAALLAAAAWRVRRRRAAR